MDNWSAFAQSSHEDYMAVADQNTGNPYTMVPPPMQYCGQPGLMSQMSQIPQPQVMQYCGQPGLVMQTLQMAQQPEMNYYGQPGLCMAPAIEPVLIGNLPVGCAGCWVGVGADGGIHNVIPSAWSMPADALSNHPPPVHAGIVESIPDTEVPDLCGTNTFVTAARPETDRIGRTQSRDTFAAMAQESNAFPPNNDHGMCDTVGNTAEEAADSAGTLQMCSDHRGGKGMGMDLQTLEGGLPLEECLTSHLSSYEVASSIGGSTVDTLTVIDDTDFPAHGTARAPRRRRGGQRRTGKEKRQPPALPIARAALPRVKESDNGAGDAASSQSGHAPDEDDIECSEVSELCHKLEGDAVEREAALTQLRGQVWQLSQHHAGCRAVQKALEVSSCNQRIAICNELRGHVRESLGSPHANYVIQKVVEQMPIEIASFVAEELFGAGACAARHRYGCRVVCRLIEQCTAAKATGVLILEILRETAELSRHTFGRHVVQSILEHCQHHRKRITKSLLGDLVRNAKNRNASYVIEKALGYCDDEDRRALASELLSSSSNVSSMAQSQFGFYVLKALLRMPGQDAAIAWSHVQEKAEELEDMKYGKRLLEFLRIKSATV